MLDRNPEPRRMPMSATDIVEEEINSLEWDIEPCTEKALSEYLTACKTIKSQLAKIAKETVMIAIIEPNPQLQAIIAWRKKNLT